ncbi:MAG: 23S rRNA (guanosine(2251)-2'-O)-methyltransferase RlmB [Anaerolineae bacterium]
MEVLVGPHAVRAALRAGRRRVHRVYVGHHRSPRPEIQEIGALCRQLGIPIESTSPTRLGHLAGGMPHQGIAAQVGPYPLVPIEAVLEVARIREKLPLLLALDGVQDPHNLGAILRTADAVGVHGVILPADRVASVTPTVSRVSAGAAEYLRVSQCVNLVRTLRQMKDEGLWIVGVEQHPDAQNLWHIAFDMPTVLVLGSEGGGMRRLTVETCDILASIPMAGHVSSLNVSVAASLALYAAARGQAESKSK